MAILIANCVLQGILATSFSTYTCCVLLRVKIRLQKSSLIKGAIIFMTINMKFVMSLYDAVKWRDESVLQWWRTILSFVENVAFLAVYLSLIFRFIGLESLEKEIEKRHRNNVLDTSYRLRTSSQWAIKKAQRFV